MSEVNLTLLLVLLLISLVSTAIAATNWCGPTWFQRNGLCFAVLSISMEVFSSDIQPDMAIAVLKPTIEILTTISAIASTVIAAFGEVIWRLIHRGELTVGQVMRGFVNS